MSLDAKTLDVFISVPTNTAETRRAAALHVASKAVDKADATQLLAALGLLPKGHPATLRPQDHGMRGWRFGCRCPKCRKAKSDDNRRVRAKDGDAS
ncbi:hypothetical protein PV729_45510 [Streptomyces europaeiscabiei]|uniref:Transposase n=1 Tax=Streptomyces europaeiscabiei TaxID=146819 RepID=A0ABU4NW42_9ACTN|nr:hypothetical protein [Streptomyces europaeiscabiei]MDX2763362.1 hypothetical protein [Streptomyces europaeiscabiei]MDX3544361.1 hypothetical protein [Streptomyces europaeiscabiei]MDX3558834.1 hypothetical protein [Streptomyces europaeiscabiei]MDX3707230.1 hypothetical protein [Streptomyces europaeiscabiei]